MRIVVREGSKNSSHLLNSFRPFLVVVVQRESSIEISVDLIFSFLLHSLLQEILVGFLKLLVLDLADGGPSCSLPRIIDRVPLQSLLAQIRCPFNGSTITLLPLLRHKSLGLWDEKRVFVI